MLTILASFAEFQWIPQPLIIHQQLEGKARTTTVIDSKTIERLSKQRSAQTEEKKSESEIEEHTS